MPKKLYISLILLITLIGPLVLVYKITFNKESVQKINHERNSESVVISKNTFPQNCSNQNKPAEFQPDQPEPDISEQGKQLTVLNLWYVLEANEDISVRLDPRIKKAKKIGFNSRIIPTLKKDDEFQLPVIENKKYLLKIKNINKKSNNDIEIFGELEHNNKIYASTLSLTKQVTLALLTTPNGNFDVRMVNNKGYIYQSGQLADQLEAVEDLPSLLLNQ